MTKQEEIREGITKIVEHYAEAMQTDGEQYPEFIAVDRILAHLKSKGVVIKVDKPSRIATSINNDGLVAVESLI